MNDRKSTSAVWSVAVALLLLLAIYAGAYYGMMHREPLTGWGTSYPIMNPDELPQIPRYFFLGHSYVQSDWVGRFFGPMHALDRCLRPYAWEPAR